MFKPKVATALIYLFLIFGGTSVYSADPGKCLPALESSELADDISQALINRGRKALDSSGLTPIEGIGPAGTWSEDGLRASYEYETWLLPAIKQVITEDAQGFEMSLGIDSYLTDFLENRRKSGHTTHVLDLMGSGLFAHRRPLLHLGLIADFEPEELEESVANTDWETVDSVTGLRFEPLDSEELPSYYPGDRVPTEVLGDIMNPETWGSLDDSLRSRSIPHLDLITMNPIGGWQQSYWNSSVENSLHALTYILGNVLKRLSSDGHFYFTVEIRAPSDLSQYPQVARIVREIEERSDFKLIIATKLSISGETTSLSGALVPKQEGSRAE